MVFFLRLFLVTPDLPEVQYHTVLRYKVLHISLVIMLNEHVDIDSIFMLKDRQRWFRVHVAMVLRFLCYLDYPHFDLDILYINSKLNI